MIAYADANYCACGGSISVDLSTGTVLRCNYCGKEKNVRVYNDGNGHISVITRVEPEKPKLKKSKDWKSIPVTSHDRKREWWNHHR